MPQLKPTNTNELARLVEEKYACLVQLHDLGARQRAHIEDGDMTQLLRLLGSKHLLIATLQRVEQDLTPFRDEDPEARTWRSTEARAECASRVAACRELLNAVVDLEKSNEELMLARRQSVAERLHQVHAAARASGAYRVHTRGAVKANSESPPPQRLGDAVSGQAAFGPSTAASGLDLTSDIR